ncbi:MAG: IscS subfamily cysteine desulfurase [Bacteroidales bacterium]
MIYLDYAATSPMSSTATDAYRQAAVKFFGNSNSLHDDGSNASAALESSRKLIASLAGDVPPQGLHFTGSGSEAVFLTVYGLAMAAKNAGNGTHLITSMAEHSCVKNSFQWLERHHGFSVTEIPATTAGTVNVDKLKKELRDDTVLVSVQHVNSETGAINPLQQIGKALENHPASFHSDCVQSFCKLGLYPGRYNLDAFSISAHKISGPKGMGAAYISPKIRWQAFIPESSQEHGFRPGTVDVPAVVSFAAAAQQMSGERDTNYRSVSATKSRFIHELNRQRGEHIQIEGDPDQSSPYICGLRVNGMEGQFAMLQCSQKGLAISTGSACQINEQKPSATMKAMGYGDEEAKQFIRFSFGPDTTADEVDQAANVLSTILKNHLEHVKL